MTRAFRVSLVAASGAQKYRRKEAWEKLRKRQTGGKANTKSTSVTSHLPSAGAENPYHDSYRNPPTSVESSSDPDLTLFRVQRPTCLPLTSSLSAESSRETLPSPSATSLKLHMEPVELAARDLFGKSSSAPLLMKQNGTKLAISNGNSKKVSVKLLIDSN